MSSVQCSVVAGIRTRSCLPVKRASVVEPQVGAGVSIYRSGLGIFSRRRGPCSWVSRLHQLQYQCDREYSYLKSQMSFTCVQGHTHTGCGACANADGTDEVCESEIMQGRASPCVGVA